MSHMSMREVLDCMPLGQEEEEEEEVVGKR